MSKDLIDLDNENALRNFDKKNKSDLSNLINVGDKTMGTSKTKRKIRK